MQMEKQGIMQGTYLVLSGFRINARCDGVRWRWYNGWGCWQDHQTGGGEGRRR
jgi:hypothetical protein